MRYHVFNSGSKGNCTLLINDNHYLLIDMGISLRKLKTKLAEVGVDFNQIEAILYTHSHKDHLSNPEYFSPRQIYSTKLTYSQVLETNELIPYQEYKIAGFKIFVLPTSHDTEGSIGFVISTENEKMVYVTDTGYIFDRALQYLKNADYYIFESNHNVKMLMQTNRAQIIKQRILGDYGHLSNEDCALYLSDAIGSKTKEIVLAHLSEEANSPEVALTTFRNIMNKKGVDISKINVRCANQQNTVSGGTLDFEKI